MFGCLIRLLMHSSGMAFASSKVKTEDTLVLKLGFKIVALGIHDLNDNQVFIRALLGLGIALKLINNT